MSGPLRSFQTVHWLTMTLSLLTFSAQGSSGGGCWSQRTGSRGMQRRDSLHICGREATAGKSRSPRGHVCMCEVAQFFLTLCDATDCSPPSSSVQGISQPRILEWIAISFSKQSSRSLWGQTPISSISRQILYH